MKPNREMEALYTMNYCTYMYNMKFKNTNQDKD